MNKSAENIIISYQQGLFEILSNYFSEIDLSEIDTSEQLRNSFIKNSMKFKKLTETYTEVATDLQQYYFKNSVAVFNAIKQINSIKLHLGGSSRFLKTHLDGVKRILLYSDTVLIPDPVYPWIETSRDEEKFELWLFIESIFFVLKLKPFITKNSPNLPVIIFPSFEKSLEKHDETTRHGIWQMVSDLCAYYINQEIKDFNHLIKYVNDNEKLFLEGVEKRNLFIPSGGEIEGVTIEEAIIQYKKGRMNYCTDNAVKAYDEMSDGILVLTGIFERVSSQYHLLENSIELECQPFICIESQAHYYELIAKMNNMRFNNIDYDSVDSHGISKAFSSENLNFLSKITADQIIMIRESDEHIKFRSELYEFVNKLPQNLSTNSKKVSIEVCHHINLMISNYSKEIKKLIDAYNKKNLITSIIATSNILMNFIPTLAPLIGTTAPLALAVKFGYDCYEQYKTSKSVTNSLIGVMSIAKNS